MSTEGLAGFAALKPAIISKVHVDLAKIHPFGTALNGSKLIHFECPTGTIESVPGFEPAFKATVTFGGDWFSMDADGQHGRVDFKGIAVTEDGHQIDLRTYGIVTMGPEASKVFNLQPDMCTVPFGYIPAKSEYIVSDPKLKFLESSVLVGNARVIVDETGVTVENRQSLVLATEAE
ncbi:uncharacterized protein F4822DRAFT_291171 [Hypoxylon trugodes]|uniref:uncharacterized protein n=1 Tax=Hypoxylon trugodes TaxID=326681 RepID=UPI00218EA342|nr:uncharacterized protein F4822DRAFT_291171 [Hypoxylon trugodes]KAI1387730.1 hypothetical protein F4822DRAFT_291171 [Hypoxylon trugodes]